MMGIKKARQKKLASKNTFGHDLPEFGNIAAA
jgi:hypothetical protein